MKLIEMLKPNYYTTTITTTIVRSNFETSATHCDYITVSCHTHCAGADGQTPLHVPRTTSTYPSNPNMLTSQGVEFKTRSTLGEWSVSIKLSVKIHVGASI